MKNFTRTIYARAVLRFGITFCIFFLTLLSHTYAQRALRRIYANNATPGTTSIPLVGAGSVSNPNNAITNTTLAERNQAANLNSSGLLASAYLNLTFADPVAANTPIHIKLGSTASLLGVGEGLRVQAISSSGGLLGSPAQVSTLLSLADGVNQYEVIFTPTVASQGVRVTFAPVAALLNGGIDVYGAYYKTSATGVACDSPEDQLNGAVGLATGVAGGVLNPLNAVDGNLNTAAVLQTAVGATGYIHSTAVFTSEGAAGDSVKVLIQRTGNLLDLQLLGSFSINTYLGNTLVNSGVTGNLLSLNLLSGTSDRYYVGFRASGAFDRIEVRTAGVANLLGNLTIYEIQRTPGAPTVAPASRNVTIYSGNTATLTASTTVTSDNVIWYGSATGTNQVSNAKTFTTPTLTQTTRYYAATQRNGCTETSLRTPAVVTVLTLTGFTNPPSGKVGQAYTGGLSATSSGTGRTLNYALATGSSLPAGLTLNANGTITGTVAASATPGTYQINVNIRDVTDGGNLTAGSHVYTLVIAPADLTLPAFALGNGTVGTPYASAALPEPTGGNPKYTFTVTNLPPGLTFDPITRVISGTPTTAGSYTVRVQVTDSSNPAQTTFRDVTVIIAPATLVLPDTTLATGQVGNPYVTTIPAARGGTTPITYTASNVPAGLTFNPTTRQITGTPSQYGTFTVTVTATDAGNPQQTATRNYSLTVNPAPLVLPAATLATAQVGTTYTATIPAATGGTTPITYTATGVPAGLSFDPATRQITGTPTQSGTFTVTVTATDGASPAQTSTRTYTLTVNPATLTLPAASPATAQVGTGYTTTLPAASGGTTPITYAATGIPAGLSFNPTTRVISGTPTTAGTFTVTLTATDAGNPQQTVSRDYTITVIPATLVLPDTSLATAQVGTSYSTTIPAATGGTTPITYAATGVPAGLTFNPETRQITGTPTQSGTFTVAVTATDAGNPQQTATRNYTLTVVPATLVLPAITLATAQVGTEYTATIPAATGGTTPITYAATGVPAGLNFDPATRQITGTPTQSGTFTITVTATDAGDPQQTASRNYTLTVVPATLVLPAATPATAQVGTSYTTTLPAASGGTTPITYAATGIPAGLSFDPATRQITGTPTTAGTFTVTLTATDAGNPQQTVSRDYTITVVPATLVLPAATLATGQVGNPYATTIPAATGGTTPITYTATGIPAGLTFDPATRQITGTPTQSGTFTVTVTATDAGNPQQTATRTYTITVNPATLILPAATLAAAQVGNDYTATIPAATGGTTPVTYAATGLPEGLSFNPTTRQITGTPTQSGNFTIEVTASDAGDPQQTATRTYTLTVNPATLVLPAATLATAQVGSSYAVTTPAATGGTTPVTYSATGLPAGLSFNPATRQITGTPTTAGTFTVTVTAADAGSPQQTVSQDYTITVIPATLVLPDATLAVGQVGSSYATTIPTATGGTTPITYAASNLPAGLTFDPDTRQITGTPTQSGTFTVTVTATDAGNPQQTATRNYTITVNPATLILPDATLAAAQVGATYTATLPAASGGTTPITYTVSGLPAGLTFNPTTRQITGTPTEFGNFTIVLTATDAGNPPQTATRSYTLTVSPSALTQPPVTLANGIAGTAYSAIIPQATGGTAPYTYVVNNLPPGLTFNPTTRQITGTPTQAGTFDNITVTVTDAGSPAQTITQTTSITITEQATPVTLIAFTAKASGNNVQLEWSTAQEKNNAHFEVQYSTNGRDFETVSTVDGKGTVTTRQNYSFVHASVNQAFIHYYRLKQVDFDGKFTLSTVRSVKLDGYVGIAMKASTDPSRNVRVFVDYGDEQLSKETTLYLMDLSGRILSSQQLELQPGRNTVEFSSGTLGSGIYLIRMDNASQKASAKVALP
ncbi:beta strand repeat-containing protein [Siphonobacter curvatus]|uniref:Dystroglycan-type cadherin-like domain-containing protein n=1 Tax=Siphonobacter curvatus TaxID=2094562 RepID=A0A2S7ILH1_9BACT|nr:putative Ig domain-containing protein [Siphonobacter curvatus]PQA58562.1 hypothetical protein C5O19_02520 [Siphonobacter curvatus]